MTVDAVARDVAHDPRVLRLDSELPAGIHARRERIADRPDQGTLRRAMAYGSVMASFNVEDFGTERVRDLSEDEIAERLAAFKRLTHFDEVPVPTTG